MIGARKVVKVECKVADCSRDEECQHAKLRLNKPTLKLAQVIQNNIWYGADDDGKITKTKLAKLVYLAEFTFFYRHLAALTGLSYYKRRQGPVPDEYFQLVEWMSDQQIIQIEKKRAGDKWEALMISLVGDQAPKRDLLSTQEIQLVQDIAQAWRPYKTAQIVAFTHHQLPWSVGPEGEPISYDLITQEREDNVCFPK